MKAIKTSGLTKFYGKNPGIQDLNLEVEEENSMDLSALTEQEKAPPSAPSWDLSAKAGEQLLSWEWTL